MAEIAGTDEFLAVLRSLIDAWCARRSLTALSHILPAYLGFAGLTDSWGELCNALRHIRAFAGDELSVAEMETVQRLLAVAGKVAYRAAGVADAGG